MLDPFPASGVFPTGQHFAVKRSLNHQMRVHHGIGTPGSSHQVPKRASTEVEFGRAEALAAPAEFGEASGIELSFAGDVFPRRMSASRRQGRNRLDGFVL